jgi:hypothetical protein
MSSEALQLFICNTEILKTKAYSYPIRPHDAVAQPSKFSVPNATFVWTARMLSIEKRTAMRVTRESRMYRNRKASQ